MGEHSTRRTLGLVGVGLVCEALYLAVTLRLPWPRHASRLHSWSELWGQGGLAACLVGVAVLMAAYLAGWWWLRHRGATRGLVWGGALVFAATLFWLLPITSDLFHYLAQAHALTDLQVNPLVEAPAAEGADALLAAFSTKYLSRPSAYGPAWIVLAAPGTLLRYDLTTGLVYLKALATVAFLLTAWLVEKLAGELYPGRQVEALYLLTWNPLVVWMAVGDGHNDVVMMAAVLLALWLLRRGQWTVSLAALVVSVWIKYTSAVLLPLWAIHVWRHERAAGPRAVRATLVSSGTVAGLVSLLFLLPLDVLGALPAMVERFLRPANSAVAGSATVTWLLLGGALLYLGVYGWIARWLAAGDGSFERLGDVAFGVVLLVFLLGAARAQPWHLIWPAALAGLSPRRWAWPLVVVLSGLLMAGQVWVEWGFAGLGGGGG